MRARSTTSMIALVLLLSAGCGDDGTGDDGATSPTTSPAPAPEDGTARGENGPAAGGGSAGTLTLGDETIAFDSARCFLEEQEAAAGGGTIEFVGQAFGTNAAGENVSIDVSRFSGESMFAGDDVSVVIGDPRAGGARSLGSSSPTGTVSLDGSVLSASSITFRDDQAAEVTASFVINC